MTIATAPTDMRLPDHREAMGLAETEYGRFLDVLRDLEPGDWGRVTDCTLWDVKALVAHNLGNMEANAAFREMIHQLRTATRRAKNSGTQMIDEMTALQVSERADLSPVELVDRVADVIPRALRGRRMLPGVLRRWVRMDAPPPLCSMRLGYLIDTIYTRDIWMHRVDISRAAGQAMALTAEHDGRLVAAIVCDWATQHGQPYDLVLDGPAGGHFQLGQHGEALRLDAVEFCRIVSGRNAAAAAGLLKTEVLF
jgi:uncharacterized protein (TIGR03083 family)